MSSLELKNFITVNEFEQIIKVITDNGEDNHIDDWMNNEEQLRMVLEAYSNTVIEEESFQDAIIPNLSDKSIERLHALLVNRFAHIAYAMKFIYDQRSAKDFQESLDGKKT